MNKSVIPFEIYFWNISNCIPSELMFHKSTSLKKNGVMQFRLFHPLQIVSYFFKSNTGDSISVPILDSVSSKVNSSLTIMIDNKDEFDVAKNEWHTIYLFFIFGYSTSWSWATQMLLSTTMCHWWQLAQFANYRLS